MTHHHSRALTAAALFLILAITPAAQADTSIFGGFGFPTGDFAAATTSGWTLGGYATADVMPIVDVGALVSYTDFVVDTRAHEVGATFGATLSAWEIEALGQVDFTFMRGFFGIGIANHSGVDDAGDSKRQTNFAWQLGVAASFEFLEGRLAYHQITTDGGSANWIGLTAGILF